MFSNPRIFDGLEPNGGYLAGTVDAMVAMIPPDIERDEAEVAKALLAMKYPAGLIGMNLLAIMSELKERK